MTVLFINIKMLWC